MSGTIQGQNIEGNRVGDSMSGTIQSKNIKGYQVGSFMSGTILFNQLQEHDGWLSSIGHRLSQGASIYQYNEKDKEYYTIYEQDNEGQKTTDQRQEINSDNGNFTPSQESKKQAIINKQDIPNIIGKRNITITDSNGQTQEINNPQGLWIIDKIEELNQQIKSGNSEFEITGNNLKGGAMFVTAIWHYLKDEAYPDELPEWKGSKMITILDEGVFNTDNYSKTREFIKKHFYIKAVISLTKDTFVPISKTATKTSILYAVKKTDLQAKQQEPIFFAHIDKVGLNTQGKVCQNDLKSILKKYFKFKEAVKSSYNGLVFNKDLFKNKVDEYGL